MSSQDVLVFILISVVVVAFLVINIFLRKKDK
jgi:Tfp pilus assembly protein PilX